uniref:Uncharacterized protein n=1 Tax=Anguilla anguilla TaxID=7936 RepID=A0A0E9XUB0_ANGAN
MDLTVYKLNVYINGFSFYFTRTHTKYKGALFSVRSTLSGCAFLAYPCRLLNLTKSKTQIFSVIHTVNG